MSDFRARRAPSPLPRSYPPQQPTVNQRFPGRPQDHLDADQKRATAVAGPLRKQHPSGGLRITSAEWKLIGAVIIFAVFIRLYVIWKPNSVVFDEVHFGRFAAKYILTQYYVDVHPPLAKLLITLAAFFTGFDGKFDFKEIGKAYENTPYVAMRLLPAIMGVAVVPITYLTLRALDCRATTSLLGALLVTVENGLITQSRHILLDSPLLFFTALTIFFWVGFSNEDRESPRHFSEQWWAWLTLTGLSLGAVASCKWVGLFTIATIGCGTIRQLWVLLGDLRVSPRMWFKHFFARAFCLIVVPILFYMFMFAIHFAILQNSGDGDGFMSSAFQHTLGGRHMQDTYLDVALGSEVSIRHVNTQGGYLHSHEHNYPAGSKQQQVTLYPHNDHNNHWRIYNATDGGEIGYDWENLPPAFLTTGTTIRLEHIITGKRLHSHDVRPPVSDVEFQNEVSGYGFPGFAGDINDNFVIEIEKGTDKESSKRVQALKTKFRLRHVLTSCYLFSHKVKLPDWGFEQQEVTCNKNAIWDNSIWFIETNTHPQLPKTAPKINYPRLGFLTKFWELQHVMWTTNAALTDRHAYDSRPWTWPTLKRGINFWVHDHRQIYLIGNPFIWWSSTVAVVLYGAARVLMILREKRGYKDFNHSVVVKYDSLCGFLTLGWGLHYFPFFLMSRQLFLHHYFPALYFAILLLCGIFDLATSTLRPRVRLQIAGVIAILALWNYYHFSPLAYGTPWTKSKCEASKWVKTWDFGCNDFHDSYSQYASSLGGIPVTSAVPKATIGGDGGRAPIVVDDPAATAKAKAPGQNFLADEGSDTTSIGNVVQPGHDIFKKDDDVRSASSSPEVQRPVPPPSDEQSTSAASYEETEGPHVEAPPPLPKEPGDLVTTEYPKEARAEGDAEELLTHEEPAVISVSESAHEREKPAPGLDA